MKKILSIFAVLMILSAAPAFAEDRADDIVVKVDGMVCDFCAQSLKKVFSKEESVNGIAVSLDEQTVTIDTKEGAELSDEKIKELIEWGGYDLVHITRATDSFKQ